MADMTPLRLYSELRDALAHEEAVESLNDPYTVSVSHVLEVAPIDAPLTPDGAGYLLAFGWHAHPGKIVAHFETLDALEAFISAHDILGRLTLLWTSVYE